MASWEPEETKVETPEWWKALFGPVDEEYFCGSNYCDDPACVGEHRESL